MKEKMIFHAIQLLLKFITKTNTSTKRVPNIDSLSSLIDRLAIENHKTAHYENAKRVEQQKDTPDQSAITNWDNLSRESCEMRSAIKNRIDALFQETIEAGKYEYFKEGRTFSPAKASAVTDLIDARYSEIGKLAAEGKLIKALEDLFQ